MGNALMYNFPQQEYKLVPNQPLLPEHIILFNLNSVAKSVRSTLWLLLLLSFQWP